MSGDAGNGTIGPYRVLGRIGKGGMGEVLLAKDPRLDRKVAIKQIRADQHPEARKRFHREARLAASLSHASIVSIFDFVQQEDHEFLVMEFVDGPSLKAWLEGPVSLAEKLLVAEQIAAGLHYAHRLGIVHRDLKTENVLITSDGQAKIADFGIARRFRAAEVAAQDETAGAQTRDRTDLLTREGALLGTYRSMSPEQAQGERADFRSDLFSFGVLLFEMFAGISPFQAEKPLETLLNLTSRPHPPLDQITPGLPSPLVRLIDHLLEKDRNLRPRSADEVLQELRQLRRGQEEETTTFFPPTTPDADGPRQPAAEGLRFPGRALGLAAVLLLLLLLGTALLIPRSPPILVAVLPARIPPAAALAAKTNRFADSIRETMQRRLRKIEGVAPIPKDEVSMALAEGLTGKAEIAKAVGADQLVQAELACDGLQCSIRIQRWSAEGKELESSESRQIQVDNLSPASLAAELLIDRSYGAANVEGPEISPEDTDLLLAIRGELYENPSHERLEQLHGDLKTLCANNPTWIDPLLLQVELLQLLYRSTRQNIHLAEARRCLSNALKINPNEMRTLLLGVYVELWSGNLAAAGRNLEAAEKLDRFEPQMLDLRAQLLEQEGRLEEALEKRKEASRQWPSWVRAHRLVRTHMLLFHWEEAKTILEELLEGLPRHRGFLSLRAALALESGAAHDAVTRYEQLFERFETNTYAVNLAIAHYLDGNGAKAIEVAQKALQKEPENAYLLLILADAHHLVGNLDQAETIYRQIVARGQREDGWQIRSVLAQAHARLNNEDKAFEWIESALAEAGPHESQIDLDAALVYTLLDHERLARRYLERIHQARKSGWLHHPDFFEHWRGRAWFDELLANQAPTESKLKESRSESALGE